MGFGNFGNAFANAYKNRQQPQQPTAGGFGTIGAIGAASQQPQHDYGNVFTGAFGSMARRQQPTYPQAVPQQYQNQMVSQQRLQEPTIGAIGKQAQEQAQNRMVDNPMRFINPPQMQVGTGVQNIPEVGRGFAGIPQGQPVLGARPQAPQGLLGAATNQLSKKERRKSKKNRRKQTRKAIAGMAYAGRRKDDR